MAVRRLKNGRWEADFYIVGKRVRITRDTKKECLSYIRERKQSESTSVAIEKRYNFDKLTYNKISDLYSEKLLSGRASDNCSYLRRSK